MAPRSSQDVVGFTRIFVLFCVLVILPALLMSGFGILAIKDVRQAARERRRERAEEISRDAKQQVASALARADNLIRMATPTTNVAQLVARARAQQDPVGPWVFLAPDGGVVDGEALLRNDKPLSVLRAALPSTTQNEVVHVPLPEGVASVQGWANGFFCYLIDAEALRANVALSMQPSNRGFTVDLQIQRDGEKPVVNAVTRLNQAAAPVEGELLSEHRLDPPFDVFTVRVTAPAGSEDRLMVIYIVLLAVFLITLAAGVVVVARLVYQETKLSRLKTDFVSHVSHELRTPLTSIRMFIETLRLGRATSPEETQQCLDLLTQETERLSHMIERVLGYARIRAGKRMFHRQPESVEGIIEDSLNAFRAQSLHHEAGYDLTVDVQAGLPEVDTDKAATIEVLLNFLHNAVKYSGNIKRIKLFAREGQRGRVVLGVRDNGPGLTAAEQRQVFDRFYQGGRLLSSAQPGSGLGLAISKAITEGQGGSVAVLSEPGQGAEFTMELPAARR
jgi:two-component system, OmpR family, phosphate regulon sensor histidine kinase PhoR